MSIWGLQLGDRGLMKKTPNALYAEIFDIMEKRLVKDLDGWLPLKNFKSPLFTKGPIHRSKERKGSRDEIS